MSFDHDVLISGGGTPGLALGLILARAGLSVGIIDPAPLSKFKLKAADGRTAALMQSAIKTLERTGVWQDALPHGAPLRTLRIIDDSTGGLKNQIVTDFPAADIGLPFFGINMPNNILRTLLAQAASAHPHITLYDQLSLTDFTADDFGVKAVLSSGRIMRARLLAGADGRQSLVRTQSVINVWQHDYGQQAITCLIDHTNPHDDISTEFHRTGGPFTLVPLPGQSASVVWVEKDADADHFMRLSKQDFTQALQDRTCGRLGKVILRTDPQACPLMGLRAQKLVGPRVVLLAEAAHVLSPLGAQGLNLSLRDVECLADSIIQSAQTGIDIGAQAPLQSYERARRADIFLRSAGTDGLTRLVSHSSRPLHEVRRAGLRTLSMIEPLRLFAMQQGMAV